MEILPVGVVSEWSLTAICCTITPDDLTWPQFLSVTIMAYLMCLKRTDRPKSWVWASPENMCTPSSGNAFERQESIKSEIISWLSFDYYEPVYKARGNVRQLWTFPLLAEWGASWIHHGRLLTWQSRVSSNLELTASLDPNYLLCFRELRGCRNEPKIEIYHIKLIFVQEITNSEKKIFWLRGM